jgi:hypothetical protein
MTIRAAFCLTGVLAAAAASAGCSDMGGSGPAGAKSFDAMSGDEHLACAVDISAYTYLMTSGTVPMNKERYSQSLLALAWHHNAYALPQGEKEQYDLINKKRTELIGKDASDAIAGRAVVCIDVANAKNEADKKPQG